MTVLRRRSDISIVKRPASMIVFDSLVSIRSINRSTDCRDRQGSEKRGISVEISCFTLRNIEILHHILLELTISIESRYIRLFENIQLHRMA
jgi:hypothetical protein